MTADDYFEVLTPSEACAFLQISRDTLDRETKAGNIPAIRIGKRIVRYRKDRLLELSAAVGGPHGR